MLLQVSFVLWVFFLAVGPNQPSPRARARVSDAHEFCRNSWNAQCVRGPRADAHACAVSPFRLATGIRRKRRRSPGEIPEPDKKITKTKKGKRKKMNRNHLEPRCFVPVWAGFVRVRRGFVRVRKGFGRLRAGSEGFGEASSRFGEVRGGFVKVQGGFVRVWEVL